MVQAECSSPGGDGYQTFFISVLLGLMDFSDTVMLCITPYSCCEQNLTCFDMLLLSLGLFS